MKRRASTAGAFPCRTSIRVRSRRSRTPARSSSTAGAASKALRARLSPVSLSLARLASGIVIFVFFLAALNSLDIYIIQGLVEKFFVYLPSIFIAAAILVLGYMLGNFAGRAALIAAVPRPGTAVGSAAASQTLDQLRATAFDTLAGGNAARRYFVEVFEIIRRELHLESANVFFQSFPGFRSGDGNERLALRQAALAEEARLLGAANEKSSLRLQSLKEQVAIEAETARQGLRAETEALARQVAGKVLGRELA